MLRNSSHVFSLWHKIQGGPDAAIKEQRVCVCVDVAVVQNHYEALVEGRFSSSCSSVNAIMKHFFIFIHSRISIILSSCDWGMMPSIMSETPFLRCYSLYLSHENLSLTSSALWCVFPFFLLSVCLFLSLQVSRHAPSYPRHPPLIIAASSRLADFFFHYTSTFSWVVLSVPLWYANCLNQRLFWLSHIF